MALTLGIDTSTLVGSVALLEDERLIAEQTLRVRANHGESLLPVVDRLLAESGKHARDLTLLGYARGPGSFTGIRIGMATVKGIALALGTPTLGVSSLRTLALHCLAAPGLVCPVVDARKGEVYFAAYRMKDAWPEEVVGEKAATPTALVQMLAELPAGTLHLLGDGLDVYGAVIGSALADRAILLPTKLTPPRGAFVAHLASSAFARGEREDLASAAPAYVRPADAEYKVPR